jgi:cation:H+ antiporter
MSLLTLILFAAGLVMLVSGAEFLVRGASRLALAVGISPLVVGLTLVAYGTSAPELAVSIQSSYTGAADIALGNVVGSNIANVLLILGLSAAVAPLLVASQLVRLEVPLMIGLSILVWLMGFDGQIGAWDGLLLVTGAVVYTSFAIWQSRRETQAVQQELQAAYDPAPVKSAGRSMLGQLGLMGVGLVLLILGANWLVEGAVELATYLGVSRLIIGLTVVAVGTSLPELATSVLASLRGERDIAVGNVVGSNIFNILTVLGFSSVVAPNGISVTSAALYFDIPVMTSVAIACLPVFFTGHVIARWEGLLFLGCYLFYVVYLILTATRHEFLPAYEFALIAFIMPLTVITLAVSLWRSWSLRRRVEAN